MEEEDGNEEEQSTNMMAYLKERELSIETPLLPTPDYLLDEQLGDVLELLIPHLSTADNRLRSATLLLERVRSGVDEDVGIKQLLRALAIHSEPHPIVTEQAVQLLHVVDAP